MANKQKNGSNSATAIGPQAGFATGLGTGEEFHLIAADNVQLVGSVWQPKKPKAVLTWLHGFAEHRKRYEHFANWMCERGIAVAAIDLRGHGESQGRRGHIKSFGDYLLDARVFLNWVVKNFPDVPILFGAHSNGGLIGARFLQEEGSKYNLRAFIMTSPFFDVAVPVPAWKAGLAKTLAGILPILAVPTGIDPAAVSHVPEIVRLYRDDPLVFTKATARWYVQTVENQKIALDKAGTIQLPGLVMQGTEDRLVSPAASRKFFESLPSKKKKWLAYEGFFHEILNETDRERVYKDMLKWLEGQL